MRLPRECYQMQNSRDDPDARITSIGALALNLFLTCEPRAGWPVAITERRTMQDFAHQMRWLVDVAYPDAPVVRVVLDNLNTHRWRPCTGSLAEARRIVKRLEFHHTPKHASG